MGVRISNLTETTTMADANTLPTDTTSGTRRISWANIKTAIFGAINGLTSKSTPVGADVIVIGDSAASFAGKKVTLTELFAQFPPVTAPVAWPPTFTGFGTVSGVSARSWRVGAELFFEITFTSGVSTATEARVSLGYNGTDGNVTTASNYPTLQHVSVISQTTGDLPVLRCLVEASKTYLVFGASAAAISPLVKRNGDVIVANGWILSFKGSVRIQGW